MLESEPAAAYSVSVADLAEETGSTDPESKLARSLSRARNRMVAEIGWDPVQAERTISVHDRSVVVVPALHVTEASAPGARVVGFDEDGVVRLSRRFTGTLTYVAGWPAGSLPGALGDVILEWASSAVDNPRALRAWATGTESETYALVPGAGPTIDSRLAPYQVGVMLA